MIVAGVMSGTSADGIDVAIVRLSGEKLKLRLKLLSHSHFAYPQPVRAAILGAMNASQISVAGLARLNFLLGELYADVILRARKSAGIVRLNLIGCHGQTIYHQGQSEKFLGRRIACTWQTGEGSVIAARTGVPVISDFRPADMAAGGNGAPLVPFLDYALFRHARTGRILQNIGGIANLTAIPASAKPEEVVAFDTGPGNMVIDQLMQMLFSRPYDRNGSTAARGKVLQDVLEHCLRRPYLRQSPPKTAGREEFGREFAKEFLQRCGRARSEDVIATATALTAQSIADAIKGFVLRTAPERANFRDYIVSGGGSKNRTLMRMLAEEAAAKGLKIRTTDEFGFPSQAKEAMAFAVLAYQTWRRQPGNVPAATGAKRPVVLGKICHV
ncbi:MAG TPA: anhydro-N-acetylmuramic acid kinase [Candidatus Angelobacter sp.]|nr:anhydro-N-acetylmuramic acid kinase [Candidatus Angelobacter sp.]